MCGCRMGGWAWLFDAMRMTNGAPAEGFENCLIMKAPCGDGCRFCGRRCRWLPIERRWYRTLKRGFRRARTYARTPLRLRMLLRCCMQWWREKACY